MLEYGDFKRAPPEMLDMTANGAGLCLIDLQSIPGSSPRTFYRIRLCRLR